MLSGIVLSTVISLAASAQAAQVKDTPSQEKSPKQSNETPLSQFYKKSPNRVSTQPRYRRDIPMVRRFERKSEDRAREVRWRSFEQSLDQMWRRYREAGSTEQAWENYLAEMAAARSQYVKKDSFYKGFGDRAKKAGPTKSNP